ncbi:hypothetical protein [Herbiconiux sp.]|nr:hypothetical protein [Herbiconiux sp.]
MSHNIDDTDARPDPEDLPDGSGSDGTDSDSTDSGSEADTASGGPADKE